MVYIVTLEQGDNIYKNNIEVFGDREMANQFCKSMEKILNVINMGLSVEEEWSIYWKEFEMIRK